ncbi:Acetyltransferase involved in cellulose biosynthesis, CelD/BcsL family [Bradyrhizobium sp. NFR13]|uniref:GNAT family N-acetyltransferase n=1 Tax=Bradyrhizobium sp. NFR13 TaxID=1566285 RepID=UPI0008E03761|nr:GNAT family N-acetyltransferase [Bradyrhizobium sp. NFR13]SFL51190.1 Acetyltransferase involved in cellulose biosynthesis, CelD/BcsL family [Bradyrhizobium sp. NFR13]
MTMAAVMETPVAMAVASRIAHVDVISHFGAAEAIWRSLESSEQLSTPYQRFDFQSAWQTHIGAQEGLKPFIIVAYDAAHQPLMLLPLAVSRENGMRVAGYLGGKHVTFNMPLFRRDFAVQATKADIDALLQGIQKHTETVDVLALVRQPKSWIGVDNPLALLPSQASTNDCPVLKMEPGEAATDRISNSFRKRLKTKEGKYRNLAGYRYMHAKTDAEVKRVLDAFFAIKPLRMAEQNLPNVFAEPGVEAFIRQACTTPRTDGYTIDIHALVCDDEMIAMFAGVADDNRFSMMFNTYTMSENAKYSPGLILMRTIIDAYAERGVTSLDLGIGGDDYKRMFCKDDEPIFDSFVPLTTRGRLGAMGLSSFAHAKRIVKQTPALLQMAQMLRQAFQR